MEFVKLKTIKNNPSNPRIIKNYRYKQLLNSLLEFPEMLELRPVVIDGDDICLGGSMRKSGFADIVKYTDVQLKDNIHGLNCSPEREEELIGMWTRHKASKTIPVERANNLSDSQKREFTLKDNAHFGDWDFDMLANDYTDEPLADWGIEGFPFDSLEEDSPNDGEEAWMQNKQQSEADQQSARSNTINRSEFDPEYKQLNEILSDDMEYLNLRISHVTAVRWKELKRILADKNDNDIMTELLNAR